jgi:hypothetical protein
MLESFYFRPHDSTDRLEFSVSVYLMCSVNLISAFVLKRNPDIVPQIHKIVTLSCQAPCCPSLVVKQIFHSSTFMTVLCVATFFFHSTPCFSMSMFSIDYVDMGLL